jgi:hypothetical protein
MRSFSEMNMATATERIPVLVMEFVEASNKRMAALEARRTEE